MILRSSTILQVAVLAASLCVAAGPASGDDGGSSAPVTTFRPRIANGLPAAGYPTTGALLHSNTAINQNTAETWCSGTLIGCQTFLTAAHCVVEDGNASHYWVYLQHGGLHQVASVVSNPSYGSGSGNDVAIVKLSSPVTGIDPTRINTTHNLDALGVGLDGTIAGFGRTGGGTDYGIKLYGAIATANCDTSETDGEGNNVLVCWDYQSPLGAPGEDSNTCNGDSGGPLFMDFAGVEEVVGVTSSGVALDCGPGDHSWDASVYYNRTWLLAQLGADSTSTCGGLPSVGDADVAVSQNIGNLSAAATSASFTIPVTGSPSVARFTLNGTDNGFNPNFFVKQGNGASSSDYDCAGSGTSVFGACEFINPAPGTWSVFVQRVGGTGRYQVTSTVFGGDPPFCGNNVKESGEACDGTDDDACSGLCQGDCSCLDLCGNNTVDAGEECDGTADGACPGLCNGDCACTQPCSTDALYGLTLVSDEIRFTYRTLLYDDDSTYSALDPTSADLTIAITDSGGSVNLSIPAGDTGWVKADTEHRRYAWKGDGSLDGIRRIKFLYRRPSSGPFWNIQIRGRSVPGADTLDLGNVLGFELGFGGTCHQQEW